MKIQVSKETRAWLDEVGVVEIRCESIQNACKHGIPVMAHVQKGGDVIFGINDRGVDVSLKGVEEFERMK